MSAIRNDVLCRKVIDYITFVLCSGNTVDTRKVLQYLQKLHNEPATAGHWIINSEDNDISNDIFNVSAILGAVVGDDNVGYCDDENGVSGKTVIIWFPSGTNNDAINDSYKYASIIGFGLKKHEFLHQKIITSHDGGDETITDDDYSAYCKGCSDGQSAFLYYIQNMDVYEPPLILKPVPKFYPYGYYQSGNGVIKYLGETPTNDVQIIALPTFREQLAVKRKGQVITTLVGNFENHQNIMAEIDKHFIIESM